MKFFNCEFNPKNLFLSQVNIFLRLPLILLILNDFVICTQGPFSIYLWGLEI